MKKRFYDPHPGLAGASIPIPEAVRLVANNLAEREFVELNEAVQQIQNACPEGKVHVFEDMISLRVGQIQHGMLTYPQHSWRVIRLEAIPPEDEFLLFQDVCPRCFNLGDEYCSVCGKNGCQR